MKYLLPLIALLLVACDNSTPKIAAPQRAELDKAKEVNQMVQQNTEDSKKKIEDAEK